MGLGILQSITTPPLMLMLLALATATLALAGCSLTIGESDHSLSSIQKAGVLQVGIDPSYPPFASVDGQGQIVGYDADLAARLGQQLGAQVQFVSIDVGTIFDGLLAKKYDVVISAIPPYPELTREIAFSEPYFNAGQVLVVRRESPVRGPADLAGSRVAVELGAAAEVEVRKLAKSTAELTIRGFESPQVVLDQLEKGEVEAAVVDRVTALEHLSRGEQLRLAGQPLTFEPYVVAMRRRDRTLLSAVNAAIRQLQQSGFLTSIEERWVGVQG